jgi:hypothetical protein
MRVCGTPEAVLAVAGRTCRQTSNPVYWALLTPIPGLPVADQMACITRAMASIQAVCGLRLEHTESIRDWEARKRDDGLILVDAHWIDGAGGTLAWSEVPCGPRKQMQQRYDTSERWYTGEGVPPAGKVSLQAVVCHEVCHALGLPHGGHDLMAPTYEPAWRVPGPWTVQELVARYGPPKRPTGGNNVGKIAVLIGLLSKIAPLIEVLIQLASSPQFQALLDLLVKVLTSTADVPTAKAELTAGVAALVLETKLGVTPTAPLIVDELSMGSLLSLLQQLGRLLDALAALKDTPQFDELVAAITDVLRTLLG